ncbi:MAG: glycoside hydrolase [Saprospiraceae bacterium]|nr:glycoside hydrolase [Saprospiraceae bacterium]
MNLPHYISLLLLPACFLYSNAQQNPSLQLLEPAISVFSSGEEGYVCFRIPAIIMTSSETLIAFAEGRKDGCSDTGNIDLVMKCSKDYGITWGPLQLIWDDQDNTCGNPAPVLDRETGNLFLLATWNLGSDRESEIINQTSEDTRRIFVIASTDLGSSWQTPREITETVKLPSWTWYATGPGSGLQLTAEGQTARLILGCDHIEAVSKKYYSHIIYSDDHGVSWHLGGSSPVDQVNECEIAELPDDRLMMNMRNYDRTQKNRQIAVSDDRGMTWYGQYHDTTLIEPICQASLHGHKDYLLFSNPASREERIDMTVRMSTDLGTTWPYSILLHAGPSAYSDLVSIDQQRFGCLFEAGKKSPYEHIVFQRIALE